MSGIMAQNMGVCEMNNVKKSIGWADFTWNPVTGCRRTCSYCYARRIHERFYKTPFSDIVLHRERLYDKMPKEPSKIFVGSMSDNVYWDVYMWDLVLDVCRDNPRHTFMFLSKDYIHYKDIQMPPNCMQGLTLTSIDTKDKLTIVDGLLSYANRPYLSIEPLLGTIADAGVWYDCLDLIIVGAMTGAGAVKPLPEWIQSVKDNVPADKIYWKKNIQPYL